MSMNISRRDFLKGAAAGALTVASCGVLSSVAFADDAAAEAAKTASATVSGFGGDVTVTLTVEPSGLISACEIVGDMETPGVGGRAIAEMPAQYLEAGSLEVDGITGATVTTTAVKKAAQSAYNEAMGVVVDPTALHMKPGKYTAGALGYWGIWELPVTITVNETSILKIEVPEDRFAHGEAEVILQSVKDVMFPRIIENQSLEVDSIAGATASSNAVKVAIGLALKEAIAEGGSDENTIERFYKKPEKPETETETIDTDILIVGMGNGGIFAFRNAIEKMQEINGGKLVNVLAIDKAGKVGGKSALTHEFNAVNPKNYMKLFNGGKKYVDAKAYKKNWLNFTTGTDGEQKAKRELVELYCDRSGEVIDWLYERGWRFGSMQYSPMADGYVSFNSVLASNTDTGSYEDRRKGVDKYYKSFLAFCEAQGGKYMLETEAYEIITDGDTITGVKARNNVTGQEYIINCKALIMGCGGFASNEKMLTELLDPKWAGPRKTLGTGMDDGKLFQAALDIGAGTWNVEMSPNIMHVGLDHWLTKYPVQQLEGTLDGRTGRMKTRTLNDIPLGMGISSDCLAVNPQGERFTNEELLIRFGLTLNEDSCCAFKAGTHYFVVYSKDQMEALAETGFTAIPKWEGYCWQGGVANATPIPEIFDAVEACVDEGMAFKGDTLEELAEAIGVDPAVLSNTVEAYNTCCANGEDADFGKDPANLKPLGEGPYYAILLKNVTFGTVGGLDVDKNIRVMKADHVTPFNGFYAIGNDSHGVILNPEHNYIGFGGVAQGWYALSGLLASDHAVEYVNDNFGLTEVSPALVQLEAVSSMH